MNRKPASLRCCASCMWIFTWAPGTPCPECPQCQFGHYGARRVFGDNAYRYAKTQKPWYDRAMRNYSDKLREKIAKKPSTAGHRQKAAPWKTSTARSPATAN